MRTSDLGFTAINRLTPPTSCPIQQSTSTLLPNGGAVPARKSALSDHLGLGCEQMSPALDELPRSPGYTRGNKTVTKERPHDKVTAESMQACVRFAKAKGRDASSSASALRKPIKRKCSSETTYSFPFPITKPGIHYDDQSKEQVPNEVPPYERLNNDIGQSVALGLMSQNHLSRSAAMQLQTPQPSSKRSRWAYEHQLSPNGTCGLRPARSDNDSPTNSLRSCENQLSSVSSNNGSLSEFLRNHEHRGKVNKLRETEPVLHLPTSVNHRQIHGHNVVNVHKDLTDVAEKDLEIDLYGLDDIACESVILSSNFGNWQGSEEVERSNSRALEDEMTDEVLMDLFLEPCLIKKTSESDSKFTLLKNEGFTPVNNFDVVQAISKSIYVDTDGDWELDESKEAELVELDEYLTPIARFDRERGTSLSVKTMEDQLQSPAILSSLNIEETPTELSVSPEDLEFGLKPIVRPAFPARVRDRSLVAGLTANTMLRVCFRIGEALNTGCDAMRRGQNIVIELYARILSSERDLIIGKQSFVFGDLFHNRPPFLNGVYEGWKDADPWDYDSAVFLEQSKDMERLCRCVGRMERKMDAWQLVILNIWEAAWEDVEYVKGIICF